MYKGRARIPMFRRIRKMGPVSEKIPSEIQELKELALSFCILEAKMNNSLKRNGLYGDPKGLINGSQQL